ncbi:hypothetical protein LA345_40465 (plasmid) [Burkholderia vietnamiensis]|uniref:Uncharacterized protein n=1 Tax=Burkholderia vietnamiensis (strain G4 / LMG 22486) TaxID=269482 RepID=A4JU20_BURVG|nr:hypothetical protein Bcep1808_6886 [Burkholderia vietnamiensis G4]MCB4350069.1 hypothetical protein [Burkholderia vietnamiensis]
MPFKDYNVAAEESVRDAFNSPTTELRFFEKVVDLFPQTVLAGEVTGPIEAHMLSLNAFQILLAGGRIALTGHASAMFPVLRTALESACYAFMILARPELAQVWRERHESNSKMDKCRSTFSNAIKVVSRECSWTPEGKQRLLDTYQGMIDYGGHPNPHSIFHAVSIDDGGDHWLANLHSVYEPDSGMARWVTLACAEAGLCIAAVLAECHRKNDKVTWNCIQQAMDELASIKQSFLASKI